MPPWEKYSSQPPASGGSGPWAKYGAPAQSAPPPQDPGFSVEPSSFDVAQHTASAAGFAPGTQIPASQAGPSEAMVRGLLTNEPVEGFLPNAARALPATIGGMIASVPGAAAGEALRQAVVAGQSVASGTQAPSPLGVVGRVGLAAAGQKAGEVAAPYVGRAIQATADGMGTAGKAIMRYAGVNLAGVKSGSYKVAEKGAGAVARYVGAEPQVGDDLAQGARDAISKAVQEGEKAYAAAVDAAKANPAYAGKTFNLQQEVGQDALKIADDFGFNSTPNLKAPPAANKYWSFAKQVDNLKNATVEEVYQFQKQLNSLAREYAGKPLGAAFKQLKGSVGKVLEQIPEIGEGNAKYAAARALEEETGKLTGSNDLLKYVVNAYRGPQSTVARQAIEKAAGSVPGLEEIVKNIHAYSAAQDFSPLLRGLPQTGFTPGMGAATLAAGKAFGGPALAAATVFSPRANLLALQGAQAAAPALRSVAGAAAAGAAAVTPALAQAFAKMSPESIAAFYRSPGAQSAH